MENMSKEEQIGFHKGSLSTLAKEREELARLISIVDQLIPMHTNALKELGVNLNNQSTGGNTSSQEQVKKRKRPIEDIL
jgi:hypothetical protein